MAQYKFEAQDMYGKVRKGRMSADSRHEVQSKLKKKRLRPVEVIEMPENFANKDIKFLQPKVKLKDLVFYLTQFSTLISAGITVIGANEMLVEQTSSATLKAALETVVDDLLAGHPLSDSYDKYPNIFPVMLTNVVRAAEMSGTLEETLKRMALYFERQNKSRNKLISSMMYPIILFCLAILVSIFLMVSVVPMFVQVFEDMDGELPGITVAVRDLSNFLQTKGWILAVVLVLIVIGINMALRVPEIRYKWHILSLRIPGFGQLIQKSNISAVVSTLSSLLTSSVPITSALHMAQGTISNLYIKEVIERSRVEVEKGNSISLAMKESWAFPALVTQMIEVGESTGALETMLAKLAEVYEEEVEVASERLKTVLEPMIILLIALIVGVIIFAIMTPMFSMYEQMQG